MYTCKFVADTGTVFFDYKHGIIFDLDPLADISIDVSSETGYGQVGETVTDRTIGSVTRKLTGYIVKRVPIVKHNMLDIMRPLTSGRLYFNDTFYCDCILKNTPIIVEGPKWPKFEVNLYCAYPYWRGKTAQEYSGTSLTVWNPGEENTDYVITLTATGSVTAPTVTIDGDDFITLSTTMTSGQSIKMYRENGQYYALLYGTDGTVSDAIQTITVDSTFFAIGTGRHTLTASASSGSAYLSMALSMVVSYAGVYDGMTEEAVEIACDLGSNGTDIGSYSTNFEYTVYSFLSSELTVYEYVDDALVKSFAADSGSTCTFSGFANYTPEEGSHTIEIRAVGTGAERSLYYDFEG